MYFRKLWNNDTLLYMLEKFWSRDLQTEEVFMPAAITKGLQIGEV